jgi:hypothetical protein
MQITGYSCHILTKHDFPQQIFETQSNIKISSSQWEATCSMRTDGRTNRLTDRENEGQTDKTKLLADFRSFVKAPKQRSCVGRHQVAVLPLIVPMPASLFCGQLNEFRVFRSTFQLYCFYRSTGRSFVVRKWKQCISKLLQILKSKTQILKFEQCAVSVF